MNGLSTKLQEHLALDTSRTFMEFVSNAIIADDVIHAHMESNDGPIRQCSSQVSDGVFSTSQSTLAASTLGYLSTIASTCSTASSGFATKCVAPTSATTEH
jgi:hypothetical protein